MDERVAALREQISANDREVVAAVNRRLELVGELRSVKDAAGLPFLDRAREQALLDELAAANGGPLTLEGLGELVAELLALTKRELERGAG